MQTDDVIWQIINNSHCSFKYKIQTQTFCRNEYNLTGLCSRKNCPLSNSRYATVLEKEGDIYLYMKTIERAHAPKNLWERVKLKSNYSKAIEQIESNLQYWPSWNIHKCKQRLTKITQYLIRMRKLKTKVRKKYVGVQKKIDKREAKRQKRAEQVARIDNAIEKELLSRLNETDTYGDIWNPIKGPFEKFLESQNNEDVPQNESESESENEDEDEDENEYEDEDEEESKVELVEDDDIFVEDQQDIEDYIKDNETDSILNLQNEIQELKDKFKKKQEQKKRKRPNTTTTTQRKKLKPQIEIEIEEEQPARDQQTN